MIGRTLSHYKILDEISRGGMGIVYRALDTKLNREVAIKVLPPELVADEERKRRFIQEAQAAAALKHPNIAVIYEIDESDGTTFIAMELIEGEKLRDLMQRERLPVARTLDLAIEVAEGLSSAHDKGIVHRDLKPANIMVSEDGRAKIIDFGLAKLLEPLAPVGSDVATALRGETESGQMLGTISYMSPEQASGASVDHRSDIFSFGVVLCEMLTGENPFQGPTNIDTLHAILRDPAPRLADADSDFQHLLDKCLAKDSAKRHQSMKDLVVALRELREGVVSGAQRAAAGAGVVKRPWTWAAALGMASAGIALGWFLFGGGRPPPGIGASGRPAIAVMYFENNTGSEEIRWLSRGLPNMLVTDLAQTPGLDVVSSERIHEILSQMGQENLETINKSLVPEVARRAGAGAVVVGSIFKLGDDVRIDVQVQDVGSGRVLSAESVRGQDVFPLVDELTGRIRTSLQLGDQTADRPIADVTTGSLEAFQLYSEGLEASINYRNVDARRLLEEAVNIDPSFAIAYFELSEATRFLGQTGLSNRYLEKALEHLDRLPDRQSLLVQAVHADEMEGDPDRAVELLETLVARYPDEEQAHRRLMRIYRDLGQLEQALAAVERGVRALPKSGPLRNNYGYALIRVGRYPEGIRELETYAELNPNEPNPRDSLAEAYLITGQPEKALEGYARTLEMDPSFYLSHQGRAWAFGMLGRFEEALTEWAKVRDIQLREGIPPNTVLFLNALTLSRVGRYREAEDELREGVEPAERVDDVETQAHLELLSAALALERNNYTGARQSTKRAQRIISRLPAEAGRHPTLVAHLLAGAAEARSGDIEAAQTHLDSQAKLYNSQSAWENWFYQALAGEIALARGDLAVAESAFLAGEPEPKMFFINVTIIVSALSNNLPFRDGLARVKKAQGDLAGAIRIYRRLNKADIGSKWTAMLEPRYVLEVARLLDEAGDREAARAEYERFLELWKNADEGLPELVEARAYLAK